MRIDKYLVDKLDLYRNKIQELIKNEKVLVNGKSVKNNYIVKDNDDVKVDGFIENNSEIIPQDIPIDVVYEDDYLMIINKKSGMVVHPGAGNYDSTLVNALLYRFNLDKTNNIRPFIVHRLDKDTSGLMLIGKDEKICDLLSSMISRKEVVRKYLAIVDGVINEDSGTIDAPIGRDKNNRLKYCITSINSKESITHFRVLDRFNDKTLIECTLETGRTHQIRVHMEYIGHSVCNDPVYGNHKNTTEYGQYLHSYYIKFKHPITNKLIEYKTDMPIEFKKYLENN